MSIFRLFRPLVFVAQKGVFFVLEYHKTHFPERYCLNKKGGKMANFGPKSRTYPFGKIPIFRPLQLLVLIAQKGVFSFQNIIKHIFFGYIASKNKMEKRPILGQNHGLTPLVKCQFFDFFNFLFLQPRKASFFSF